MPEADTVMTVEVEVRVRQGQRVRLVTAFRRRAEARLWNSLEPVQERAAFAIGAAHAILSQGIGFRSGMPAVKGWEETLEGPGETLSPDERVERQKFLCHCYFDWQRLCDDEGVSFEAVLDLIARGQGLRAVEQQRKRRNGWARQQLDLALELYAGHRGWLRRSST